MPWPPVARTVRCRGPAADTRTTPANERGRAVSVAVDDVSFGVSPGETVGVVGESGSGKTTITRAILGLTAIQSGEVLFGGQDVTNLDFAGRRRLYRQAQLVFQDPYSSLNPSRTVERTLAEPLQAYGEKDAGRVRARVEGPRDVIETFVRALEKGPPLSQVRAVSVHWVPSTGGFAGFDVRAGSAP